GIVSSVTGRTKQRSGLRHSVPGLGFFTYEAGVNRERCLRLGVQNQRNKRSKAGRTFNENGLRFARANDPLQVTRTGRAVMTDGEIDDAVRDQGSERSIERTLRHPRSHFFAS